MEGERSEQLSEINKREKAILEIQKKREELIEESIEKAKERYEAEKEIKKEQEETAGEAMPKEIKTDEVKVGGIKPEETGTEGKRILEAKITPSKEEREVFPEIKGEEGKELSDEELEKILESIEIEKPEVIEELEKIKERVPEVVLEEEKEEEPVEPVKTSEAEQLKAKEGKPKEIEVAPTEVKEVEVKSQEIEIGEKEKREKDVLNTFKKEFHISGKKLESLEGFKDLTEGQQRLIIENLRQITLGRIKEEGVKKHREELKEVGFMKRFLKGVSKKYQVARIEKGTYEEIMKGGWKTHGQVLGQLVKGMRENPIDVKVLEDGDLEISYAHGFENLDENQQKIVDEFNQTASEFRKMPYEWSLDSATFGEQKKFKPIALKFDEALDKLSQLKYETSKAGKEEKISGASLYLYRSEVKNKVLLDQFLASHPEVEEKLQNIKSKKAWQQVWKDIVTERGLYFGAGFLTRTATMSIAGVVGLPIAAAFTGAWIAKRRAKETLLEREKLARRGERDISKEAKAFVYADKLVEKIENLREKISKTKGKEKKDLIETLRIRLNYTQTKINQGLVNFGSDKERLKNQQELLAALQEVRIELSLNEIETENDILLQRLGSYMATKEKSVNRAVKKYLRKQMARGAGFGALFAGLGMGARQALAEFGWWPGGKGPAPSEVPAGKGEIPPEVTIPKGGVLRPPTPEELIEGKKAKIAEFWEAKPDKLKTRIEDLFKEEEKPQGAEFGKPDLEVPPLSPEELAAPRAEIISPEIEKQIELATVGKGEGIEHALIKQLMKDDEIAKNFGYRGSLTDEAGRKLWAQGEVHRIAIKTGYVDPETGREIGVLDLGKPGKEGNPAYVLSGNKENPVVQEFIAGKKAGEPGLGHKDAYEYVFDKEKAVREAAEIAKKEVSPEKLAKIQTVEEIKMRFPKELLKKWQELSPWEPQERTGKDVINKLLDTFHHPEKYKISHPGDSESDIRNHATQTLGKYLEDHPYQSKFLADQEIIKVLEDKGYKISETIGIGQEIEKLSYQVLPETDKLGNIRSKWQEAYLLDKETGMKLWLREEKGQYKVDFKVSEPKGKGETLEIGRIVTIKDLKIKLAEMILKLKEK